MKIEIVDYHREINSITYIRTQVFQREQGVSGELEFDGQDELATHLLAYVETEAVGTLRMRQIDDRNIKIERLAVLSHMRNRGIGTKLMQKALAIITKQNNFRIIIHAQARVCKMYRKLGFSPVGEIFLEADIPHLKMVYNLEASGEISTKTC